MWSGFGENGSGITRIIASHSAVCAEASGEARRDVTVDLFVSFAICLREPSGPKANGRGDPCRAWSVIG